MASPRSSASSAGLTAGQPGPRRRLPRPHLRRAVQGHARVRRPHAAGPRRALGVDKSTVQGMGDGRRPLTSARAGTLSPRGSRCSTSAQIPQLVDSLDTAAEADHLLDRLLDDDTGRHPFASRVLPQPLSDLLAWPLNPNPPRVVASARGQLDGDPVTTGPMLTADDRRRLLTNLRAAAENPSAPADRVLAGPPSGRLPGLLRPRPGDRPLAGRTSRRCRPHRRRQPLLAWLAGRPARSPSPSAGRATPEPWPASSGSADGRHVGDRKPELLGVLGRRNPSASSATTPSWAPASAAGAD